MFLLHLIASALAMCVGLLLVLFAGIYLGWVGGSIRIASQSTRWPTTEGVVTRSEVRSNRQANGLLGYRYILAYTYSADARQLEGTMLSGCVFPYSTRAWATKRLAPYPVDTRVQVRYSPDDPEISLLEPGWTLEALYPVGTLAVVTGLGLAATVWGVLHGWATLFS